MFFFTGPLLLTFAMIFEWIMGNFFPMMVMGLFSVFWLSFGMLQLPTLSLGAPFATTTDPTGTTAAAFNAAIALYLVVWGFALLTFFFFTLKINIVFASIFGLVTAAAWILAGAYFKVSTQQYDTALKLQKVIMRAPPYAFDHQLRGGLIFLERIAQAGGALIFIVSLLGWYACFIIMAAEMRVPVSLPMGDLSRFWPSTDVPISQQGSTASREHDD